MSTDTLTFLLKLIAAVIYDIGIPIEEKRSFERSLKRNIREAQKKYINNHEAYGVLEEEWFHRYLRHCMSVQGLCRYTLEKESWKWAKRIYIRNLASDVRVYADVWADGISDAQEMALRNFYRMLMRVMDETVKPLKQGYLLPLTYETVYGIRREDRAAGRYAGRSAQIGAAEVLSAIRIPEEAEKASAFLGRWREYGDWDIWLEEAISCYRSPKGGDWETAELVYRYAVDYRADVLAGLLRQYFIRTGTLWLVILWEIGRMEAGEKNWWVLSSLVNEEAKRRLVEEYRNHKLEDHQIRCCLKALITSRIYQQYWTGDVPDEDPYYRALIELYRERVRLGQWEYEWVDYEALIADGEAAYLAALTDRERYYSLAEELLEAGKRDDWTRIEFWDYPREILSRRLDLKAVARDFYLNRDDMSMRKWMVCLAGAQWEHYASFYIYQWLTRHQRKRVPDEIERQARQYYDRHVGTVDFRGAIIWKTDSSMDYQGAVAEMVTLFAERFGYDMPKEKAKELLFWSPYPGRQRSWLPKRYLTEEEIREQVIANMMTGELKGDVMRWHIRYCIDHNIRECAPVIFRAARNPVRNVWVRKDALAYACGLMGIREACKELLPGLKGELFFFVVDYFRDTLDRELADIVWNYGEEYPSQKLRSDICLILMQDRRGVESLSRHLQRRNGMPTELVSPGPAEAIRGIRRVELTDELERLLRSAWRPGFRDDPDDGLMDAAAAALVQIARSGGEGYERVMQVFERLMVRYREDEGKVSAIKAWVRESRNGALA